jgi:cGMP-dependent protein kinase
MDSRILVDSVQEAITAEIHEASKSAKDFEIIKHSLSKHFIFKNLRENYITVIIHHMRLFTMKPAEVVFMQGSAASNFYVVCKGRLEVLINSKRIKTLNPGDSFGEMALLHNTPRTATVQTMTSCNLWVLDRKTFRSTLELLEQANYEENKAFIESIPVFEVLTKGQKDTLVHSLTNHNFVPGSVIVNEGDPGDLLYIIKQGIVLVTKNNQEVRRMGKGFYFGEQALLYASPRTATVTAVDHVKCVAISGGELTELLGNKLQDIIYRNSITISVEKNEVLRKLTKGQIEVVVQNMRVLSFEEQDQVVATGTRFNEFFLIVVKGELVLKDSKVVVGKVFDAVNAENMLRGVSGEYFEPVVSSCESTVAMMDRLTFEKCLGGSFDQITANNDALKILSRIQILRGISVEALESLIKALKVQEYPPDSIVVSQNDPGDGFFIVKSGKAEVSKDGVTLRTITKHDYFGERSLLFNNFRSATVKAKGHLVCWIIFKSQFAALLEDSIRRQLLARIELQDDTVHFEDLSLIKQLGSGMFGNVFLAVHKKNRTLYAVKTVDRRKVAAYDIHENIVLERKILLELDHVFIMKMVRTFKDSSRLYFLLEFIQGMDLFDVLRELGLLNDLDTRFYTACILVIIEHLHERDIIYRDLKPENIVVDEEGYPKLIDFGTAKFIKGRTFTIVGTPHYMAPEVVTGHGYSTSADFWSIGVMIYEFLFGKVPFGEEESDPYVIYEKIQQRNLEFPKWSDKKSRSKDFISQMLSPNPGKRLCGGLENTKSHPWFSGLDWDQLLSKKIKAPYVPKVTNLRSDIDAAIRNPKNTLEVILKVENKTDVPPPRKRKVKIPESWDQDF